MCTQLKAEDSSVHSEEYVTVFTSYISTCIDNIVMLQNVSKPEATVELYMPCYMHAPLHSPLVMQIETERPDMICVDTSWKPRGSTD